MGKILNFDASNDAQKTTNGNLGTGTIIMSAAGYCCWQQLRI